MWSIWEAAHNPVWILAAMAVATGLTALTKFLVITPLRNWRAHIRSQKKVVQDLLEVFLKNRRVLDSPFSWEMPGKSIKSIYEIRTRLGEDRERLDKDSRAVRPVEKMQAACRRFLSRVELLPPVPDSEMATYPNAAKDRTEFEQALHEMREAFDTEMDRLYREYRITKGERPVDYGPIGPPTGRRGLRVTPRKPKPPS